MKKIFSILPFVNLVSQLAEGEVLRETSHARSILALDDVQPEHIDAFFWKCAGLPMKQCLDKLAWRRSRCEKCNTISVLENHITRSHCFRCDKSHLTCGVESAIRQFLAWLNGDHVQYNSLNQEFILIELGVPYNVQIELFIRFNGRTAEEVLSHTQYVCLSCKHRFDSGKMFPGTCPDCGSKDVLDTNSNED